ncbi:MAG: hypothetical protein V1753_09775 [Pseudomonadota bacterium]
MGIHFGYNIEASIEAEGVPDMITLGIIGLGQSGKKNYFFRSDKRSTWQMPGAATRH